jgi:hypothetical protein
MPHLLCFLAGRIAQPHHRLERGQPVQRLAGEVSIALVCTLGDRLGEGTLHILKRIYLDKAAISWLLLVCARSGRLRSCLALHFRS